MLRSKRVIALEMNKTAFALAFCEFVEFAGGFYNLLSDRRCKPRKVGIGISFLASPCRVVGEVWLMPGLNVSSINQRADSCLELCRPVHEQGVCEYCRWLYK